MSVTRPRLFLVDTFGLIFRAYYGRARSAVQAMRTSAGLPTEAVYVFNNMLKRILEDHRPEHIAAVWEGQGPTFRERIYPKYKANREKMPEDLATQLPYIKRLLECWNVPVLQEDGYEADDTIGRLAVHAAERGVDVWIVSSDKDLMQVVREGVALLDPMKKTRYQSSDVERFLGVKPEHVSDYLALRGDPVDNIPGAPGIGVKGAQQLIKAYGDIEQIIQHAGEVKRKTYRESLQNNAEQIRLSKRLASLDTAGSLRLDLEGAKQRPPDPDQLLEFYRELEFNSLAIQMEATFGQQKAESEARTFESAEEFRDWLDRSSGPLAIAVLGAEERRNAGTVAEGIGFSLGRGELWRLPAKFVPHARELLETGGREIWVHDWKSAIHALDALGIAFRKAADDTMLMAFLTDSSRTNYSLSKTVERRLGTKWEPDAAVAAAHTRTFRERLDGEIDKMELRPLYETVELPLVPVLARMESAGILLDPSVLANLSLRLGQDIDALGEEIHGLAGRKFNIGSPKQLGEVLYQDLGLPTPRKRGKTKAPSTASDILESLADKHPIPGKVLNWRQFSKLRNTYVDVLPKLVGPDGRLHTTFNPTGSATGRLSSLNPNLQNVPARTALGREIRKAFVAQPGWQLVAADYSQIELRVLAHMSGDPKLVDAFLSGADIHVQTAAEVLGIPTALVGPEERYRAKAVNFGIIYGLSPFGLAKQLGITRRSARDYINRYFERYGTIKAFIAETVERTKARGFSQTLFGRCRPVRDLGSRNATARRFAERIAVNSPIQGTAADLIKKAMVTTDGALRERGLRARMLLQVHDELLIEAPHDEIARVAGLVKCEMEGAAELKVPLVADVKIGPNWRDLERSG
jgi:DNA polymerase-1